MLNRYGRCGKRRPHIHRVSHTSHSDYYYCFKRKRPTDSAREADYVPPRYYRWVTLSSSLPAIR
jgi:hypothetical protein